MRPLIIVLFALTSLASASSFAAAQEDDAGWRFGSAWTTLRLGIHRDPAPEAGLYGLYAFDPMLGASCFALTADAFGQIYCGPTLTLGTVQVGQNIGLTTRQKEVPIRAASTLSVSDDLWDLTGVVEYGSGGFFHRAVVRYGRIDTEFAPAWHVGAVSTRFAGEGLYVDHQWEHVRISAALVLGIEDLVRDETGANAFDFIRSEATFRVTL